MNPISLGPNADTEVLERIAAAYGDLPGVIAVAVAGSRQAGTEDDRSDLDLYVYSPEPVPLAARREIAARFALDAEIGNAFWEPGDEWEDRATGVAVDVMFRSPGWIEDELDRVLVRHDADAFPRKKSAGDFPGGIPHLDRLHPQGGPRTFKASATVDF